MGFYRRRGYHYPRRSIDPVQLHPASSPTCPDGDAHGHAHLHGYHPADLDVYTHLDADSLSAARVHGHANQHADPNTDLYRNADENADANTHPNQHRDANQDAYGDPHADGDAYANQHRNANSDADGDSNTDGDPHANGHPHAESDVNLSATIRYADRAGNQHAHGNGDHAHADDPSRRSGGDFAYAHGALVDGLFRQGG